MLAGRLRAGGDGSDPLEDTPDAAGGFGDVLPGS